MKYSTRQRLITPHTPGKNQKEKLHKHKREKNYNTELNHALSQHCCNLRAPQICQNHFPKPQAG